MLSTLQAPADVLQCARIMFSLALMGYKPMDAGYSQFLTASQQCVASFSPLQLCNTLWAVSELGTPVPVMWCVTWLQALQPLITKLGSMQSCDVVWALAKLQLVPPADSSSSGSTLQQPTTAATAVAGEAGDDAAVVVVHKVLSDFVSNWHQASIPVIQSMEPDILIKTMQAVAHLCLPELPLITPLNQALFESASDTADISSMVTDTGRTLLLLPLPPSDWIEAAVARMHVTRTAYSEDGIADAFEAVGVMLQDHPDRDWLLGLVPRPAHNTSSSRLTSGSGSSGSSSSSSSSTIKQVGVAAAQQQVGSSQGVAVAEAGGSFVWQQLADMAMVCFWQLPEAQDVTVLLRLLTSLQE